MKARSNLTNIVKLCCGVLGLSALSIGLLGCGDSAPKEQESYTIKFSHVVSSGTPKGKAADFFAKRVEELSQGKIKVEVFPSTQLVDDDKVFQELKRNNVQMAAPSFSKFTPIVKEFNLWDVPFIFRDSEHLHKVMDGEVGDILKEKIAQKGFIALDYWDAGFKHFSSNKKPIIVPEDAKGQKLRIQTSKVLEEQIKAMGANPQVINFGEVYSALQTGVVDGTENPLSNFYNSKFYEVQKSLTLSSHGYLGYLVVMSEKFWRELPSDLQEVVKQAIKEATEFEREESARDESQLLANLNDYAKQSDKLTIYTLSNEQKAQWTSTMKAIYPKLYGIVGKELIQKTLETN
ncbi:DctP family TRAP transporter solute-binding subunit [Helicobacter sp.]|uniref:DctP family TRAP transporter solute-binding subunit n=1 Tax=Helicobacter sp. TaxID=218 RepID=UPI0025BAA94F|nr:DctP family TRAP transporter solute-binding subunit [Helicobacter sp.]MBR2494977.1 DctP family TRAP transporter solute-binding subunit [Helicobacter sp.]